MLGSIIEFSRRSNICTSKLASINPGQDRFKITKVFFANFVKRFSNGLTVEQIFKDCLLYRVVKDNPVSSLHAYRHIQIVIRHYFYALGKQKYVVEVI